MILVISYFALELHFLDLDTDLDMEKGFMIGGCRE